MTFWHTRLFLNSCQSKRLPLQWGKKARGKLAYFFSPPLYYCFCGIAGFLQVNSDSLCRRELESSSAQPKILRLRTDYKRQCHVPYLDCHGCASFVNYGLLEAIQPVPQSRNPNQAAQAQADNPALAWATQLFCH